MRTHRVQTALIAIVCSAITAVLISSVSAFADGDPATDGVAKLIPYSGTLERNGVAITGDVEMTFRIYDSDVVDPVWTETQVVPVHAGRFAVLLGSAEPPSAAALRQAISNADDLYLEIVLKEGITEIPLGNKQRFLPVPYALWTTTSSHFTVADGATIAGAENNGSSAALEINDSSNKMLIDGDEIDSSATLNLNANSGQPVSTGASMRIGNRLTVVGTDLALGGGEPDRGDGGLAMVHLSGDQLSVNYQGSFSGGVKINGGADGDVVVNGGDNTGTSAALHVVSGTQQMLIDGNEIDSVGEVVHISNNTSMGAYVHGPLTTNPKLVEMTLVDFPNDDMEIKTNYTTSEWNCIVGSFDFLNGDINENDSHANVILAHTYVGGDGYWHIYAELISHNNHEDHKIGLVCFNVSISQRNSWW